MKQQTKDLVFILAVVFGVIAAVTTATVVLVGYAEEAKCKSQADRMGFRHEYGKHQGCMIEPKPGQWVPMSNYRVL